jgi:hypothetical protein
MVTFAAELLAAASPAARLTRSSTHAKPAQGDRNPPSKSPATSPGTSLRTPLRALPLVMIGGRPSVGWSSLILPSESTMSKFDVGRFGASLKARLGLARLEMGLLGVLRMLAMLGRDRESIGHGGVLGFGVFC